MTVSVVITVLNEAASLPDLLISLEAQTRRPDEIVLVDGGSADGTPDTARSFSACLPLLVIERPGSTIAEGRNAAIEAAKGDVIAVTDGGVRLVSGWLDALIRPLEDGVADVSAGFFEPDPRTLFEIVLGCATLPSKAEIDPARFLPSSRSVAFTRAAWQLAGGYPEWLDYCEDLVFDLQLKQAGCRFAWSPDAIARFRPRQSLGGFFRQYYHYARGDGKADLWRRRHVVRYAAYLAFIGGLGVPVLWPLIAAGGAAYLYRPAIKLAPHLASLEPAQRMRAAALLPLIRGVGDVAKMFGYPAGVWWRLHHRR